MRPNGIFQAGFGLADVPGTSPFFYEMDHVDGHAQSIWSTPSDSGVWPGGVGATLELVSIVITPCQRVTTVDDEMQIVPICVFRSSGQTGQQWIDEGSPTQGFSDKGPPYMFGHHQPTKVARWGDDEMTETQRIYNDASGGTFTLSFDGAGPTTDLAWNATRNQVRAALQALSSIDALTVSSFTSGGLGTTFDSNDIGYFHNPWLINFGSGYPPSPLHGVDLPMITADDTNLTGHTIGTTIAEHFKGGAGPSIPIGGTREDLIFDSYHVGRGWRWTPPPEERLRTSVDWPTIGVRYTNVGAGVGPDPSYIFGMLFNWREYS